ncbi:MAG: serine/threonine protein kinase, partial [Pirellulales bacterium]|nr:serine/threonine protein kinase [Pirellulales bacterium]
MPYEHPQLGERCEPLDTESILDRFESAWRAGETPRIEDYVPAGPELPADESGPERNGAVDPAARRELLGELVMLDLWYRWRQAETDARRRQTGPADRAVQPIPDRRSLPARPLLEDYLDRFPDLGPLDRVNVAVIAEEYRVRRRFDASVDKDAYLERFPSQAALLARTLAEVERKLVDDTLAYPSATAKEATPAAEPTLSEPRAAGKPAVPDRIGKYRVIAQLDEGGQATVYRAVHPTLDKELVVKLGRRPLREGTAEADRLIAEGKLLAELEHPNLARVYDLDLDEGRPFLVMEFVRGRNLRQYAEQNPLSPRQSALLVAKIARALGAAHARGIIHQDLKPANILIDDSGEPRIIDFGLARFRHGWSESPAESGSIAGTVQYMSPEQARGDAGTVSHRSDLFALGAILYYLLTGKPPYAGQDFASLLDRAGRCDFDRSALDGVPRRIGRVCLRAMETDPAARYPNAGEMAAELKRAARPRWPAALAGALV